MGNRDKRPNPVHDPVYAELRVWLREIREESGLTMIELGEAFRRPHTFVHKVEAGDRRIDPVELCRWCQACGVAPETLIQKLAKRVSRSKPH